jgi:hypothetical protein
VAKCRVFPEAVSGLNVRYGWSFVGNEITFWVKGVVHGVIVENLRKLYVAPLHARETSGTDHGLLHRGDRGAYGWLIYVAGSVNIKVFASAHGEVYSQKYCLPQTNNLATGGGLFPSLFL